MLVLIRCWPTIVYWSNRSTFSYRTLQPRQAKFSPDGSLLAVAHDQGQLTLWDVGTNAMLQALSCTDVKDSQECAFLGKSGRYVVLSGRHTLAVWDLVSGKGSCPLILNGVSRTEGV
jgi:NET1-associated nuclear protein 1 (U3 small nucleolar RNA-associated protein 17)